MYIQKEQSWEEESLDHSDREQDSVHGRTQAEPNFAKQEHQTSVIDNREVFVKDEMILLNDDPVVRLRIRWKVEKCCLLAPR